MRQSSMVAWLAGVGLLAILLLFAMPSFMSAKKAPLPDRTSMEDVTAEPEPDDIAEGGVPSKPLAEMPPPEPEKDMAPAQEPEMVPTQEPEPVTVEEAQEAPRMPSVVTSEAPPVLKDAAPGFDSYEVKLQATEEISLPGPAGEMWVWIGEQGLAPDTQTGMASDTATISAMNQQSATINPWSTGFAFTPARSGCFLLDRAGITQRFSMKPHESGSYTVGADVYLYRSEDCSGTPVPREATALEVAVSVDKSKLVGNHLMELWHIFWAKLLEFWGWLVGFLFLALGAFIRSRVKSRLAAKGVKLPEEENDS